MRRPCRHRHRIPRLGHDQLALQAVEMHTSLRDQEPFVVHLVPVRRRTARVRRQNKLGYSETVIL